MELRSAAATDHRTITDAIPRWGSHLRTQTQKRELALLVPPLFLQHFASTSLVAEADGELKGRYPTY